MIFSGRMGTRSGLWCKKLQEGVLMEAWKQRLIVTSIVVTFLTYFRVGMMDIPGAANRSKREQKAATRDISRWNRSFRKREILA